jgi:hypothetical protein
MKQIFDITEEINTLSQWIVDNCDAIATSKYNSDIANAKAKEIEASIADAYKEEGAAKSKIIAANDPKVVKSLQEARPLKLNHLLLSTRHQAIVTRLDALKSILMAELAVLKHTNH